MTVHAIIMQTTNPAKTDKAAAYRTNAVIILLTQTTTVYAIIMQTINPAKTDRDAACRTNAVIILLTQTTTAYAIIMQTTNPAKTDRDAACITDAAYEADTANKKELLCGTNKRLTGQSISIPIPFGGFA